MKYVTSKNGVLFLLLIGGLTFNILWSMRLEIKAAAVKSRVDEYHERLERGFDDLDGLTSFHRQVEDNDIRMEGFSIQLRAGENFIEVDQNSGSSLSYGENTQVLCDETGTGILTGPVGRASQLLVRDKDIMMVVGDNPGAFYFRLDAEQEKLLLVKDKAVIGIGKGETGEGVEIGEVEAGTIAVIKDKGVGIAARPGKPVNIKGGNKIELTKDQCKVRVGEGSLGEGVELGEFDTGTIAVTKGRGVAILGTKGHPIEITAEERLYVTSLGNIDIEAKGSINISSTNGQVRINGQQVHLNTPE
jgi:hypothetical protein